MATSCRHKVHSLTKILPALVTVAIFVIADCHTTVQTKCVGVYIMSVRIKFHMPTKLNGASFEPKSLFHARHVVVIDNRK
jgi:hypothetical protein